MRDVHTALFLPDLSGGGAERVTVRLAREFAHRGIRVDLVLASARGPYLNQVPPEVGIVDLKTHRVLRSLPRLIHYLRQQRPDVLLSTMSHANVIAIVARHAAAVRTRLAVRETIAPISQAKNLKLLSVKITLVSMRLYCYADLIIANSRHVVSELSHLLKLPPSQIRHIPNPIVDRELCMLAQQPVEHPWFQDSSMPIVLSVGRLSPQKDFATLIRAIAQVNRHMPCRLIILGKGEQRAELERLVEQLGLQQRVWMPGFDPNPYRYMARATLFVLPSRWEGSPNALVEALACGIPVIATDSPGGAREILEDGRWGILTPVGNPEALAEAILQTLQRPVDREALRRRAQDFSVDKIANQYLNALGIHHGSQPVDLAKTSNS